MNKNLIMFLLKILIDQGIQKQNIKKEKLLHVMFTKFYY